MKMLIGNNLLASWQISGVLNALEHAGKIEQRSMWLVETDYPTGFVIGNLCGALDIEFEVLPEPVPDPVVEDATGVPVIEADMPGIDEMTAMTADDASADEAGPTRGDLMARALNSEPKIAEEDAVFVDQVPIRTCKICGADIGRLRKGRTICMDPMCEAEDKRRYRTAYYARKKVENRADPPTTSERYHVGGFVPIWMTRSELEEKISGGEIPEGSIVLEGERPEERMRWRMENGMLMPAPIKRPAADE